MKTFPGSWPHAEQNNIVFACRTTTICSSESKLNGRKHKQFEGEYQSHQAVLSESISSKDKER